ncbi:MAG: nuclear transport factor 2 family protein [Desertimonas sp.]
MTLISRDHIAEVLRRLNGAENLRPESSVEETSRRIDQVMGADVEGWTNGVHVPDRAAERRTERWLFASVEDYQRDIERLIVEPPFATITWTIRGTANGRELRVPGSSIFEFGDDGLIRRYWLYCDPTKFGPLSAR